MSVIAGHPHKFPKPTVGDVYQREQQDGRWEYGQIIGIRETRIPTNDGSDKFEWLAHLSNGWVDFRDIIRSDTHYASTEDWHPAPTGTLVAKLNALESRVAALEAASVQPVAARPSRTSVTG